MKFCIPRYALLVARVLRKLHFPQLRPSPLITCSNVAKFSAHQNTATLLVCRGVEGVARRQHELRHS